MQCDQCNCGEGVGMTMVNKTEALMHYVIQFKIYPKIFQILVTQYNKCIII